MSEIVRDPSGNLAFEEDQVGLLDSFDWGSSYREHLYLGGAPIGFVEYEWGGAGNLRLGVRDRQGSEVRSLLFPFASFVQREFAPFGLQMQKPVPAASGLIWGGGEYSRAVDLNYLKARYQSPKAARFMAPDPVAAHMGDPDSLNVYLYTRNDPNTYVDPSGEFLETAWDLESIGMGIASLHANIKDENWGAAAVDAVGLALDTASLLTPGVPAVGGKTIQAARAGDAAVDGLKAVAKVADEVAEVAKQTYSRVKLRKTTREKVWKNGVESATGRVRDPKTGQFMSRQKPWDAGHKPGHEFRKSRKSAQKRGISREEFIEEQNNPNIYRPELPSSNRSHSLEAPDEIFLGD